MVKRSEPCKVCCHNERGTLIVIRSEREGSATIVREMVRRHNDGGTLSIIMTENIKRHSERQRRICYRGEENGKTSSE